MAKRKQDVKVTQSIKTEKTELFQTLSDQQAETVKGGSVASIQLNGQRLNLCTRTSKLMF